MAADILPGRRLAQAAFGLLIALRVGLDIWVPPIGDEAYYWMWGQKPAWSYLDHPPLHAWLLHIVGLVLGWNLFSLRALTWLTLGGTLWIVWLWAKRLKPDDPGAWFWPSAAVYLASPLFFIMSAISFHDHLLIFLCLLTVHLFLVFAEKWEAGERGYRWLYAAAPALGLTVLTKYNGVLLGVGVAAFFAIHKPLRPLWRSPHLYLAALLAVAIQAPVFWWNLTSGFASYNFHLSERWSGGGVSFRPIAAIGFVLSAILVVSPFLVPALVRTIREPSSDPFADRARLLAICAFIASCVLMVGLSLFVEVYFYWNILAVLPLMPLFAGRIGRWGFRLHLVYGVVIAALVVFNYGIIPIGSLTGQPDWYATSNFGWPEVATRVLALERDHPVGFVATTRYSTAAQLGYAMHDVNVTALSDRPDEYDYWFVPAEHADQDALIIADSNNGIGAVASHFASVTPLETDQFVRFGVTIYTAKIYLAQGFKP